LSKIISLNNEAFNQRLFSYAEKSDIWNDYSDHPELTGIKVQEVESWSTQRDVTWSLIS